MTQPRVLAPWERYPSPLPGRFFMERWKMRFILVVLAAVLASTVSLQPSHVEAQSPVVEEVSNNKFRSALLKAAQEAAKKGELKRIDVVRLRVATLSPAFLERAEMLAKVQMSASGEDIPVDEDGRIEIRDWDAFLQFLIKLLPLLLKLLDAFTFLPSLDVTAVV
jgi:hypothetical protein